MVFLEMPVKTPMPFNLGIYFITYTCFRWLPLIHITKSFDLVYKSFDYLKKQGHYISGYVIMPNHVHSLIAFRDKGKNLNKLIGDSKRFMAYEMVQRLQTARNEKILKQLTEGVTVSDRRRRKLHGVWKDSFDWKLCDRIEMIEQKLNYIHNNPCTGKWKLVESPVDYDHSSAKFYTTGEQGIYPVTNYMELGDVDLTK